MKEILWTMYKYFVYGSLSLLIVVSLTIFFCCLVLHVRDYRQRKYQRGYVIGAPDKSCARRHPEPN